MNTISALIAHEREAIMARWLEQAHRAASARGLDHPALMDLMPRYLASLAAGEDGSEHVDRHFATRLRQGFQLAEIVDEFALLGRCIMDRSFAGPAELRPDASAVPCASPAVSVTGSPCLRSPVRPGTMRTITRQVDGISESP